jgi:hypothetical protein
MVTSQCPHCGNPVRVGARFCPGCGASITSIPVPPAPPLSQPKVSPEVGVQGKYPDAPIRSERESVSELLCSRCGKSLRPGAKFCPSCGNPVAAGMQARPPESVQSPDFGPRPSVGGSPDLTAESARSKNRSNRYWLLHGSVILALTACLFLSLAGAFITDLNQPEEMIPTPQISPVVMAPLIPATASPDQRQVIIGIMDSGRFGLRAGTGDLPENVRGKYLTFSTVGETSNTRVWIDGQDWIFGDPDLEQYVRTRSGDTPFVWKWEKNGIRVTQSLDYVLGGSNDGDTIRIAYELENMDTVSHQVGLRMMVDTLIGDNDGVPFLIPGQAGITATAIDLRGEDVPDSIQALERNTLADPGVIVNLTLRGVDATPPDRLAIAGWAGENVEWDILDAVGGVGTPLTRGGIPGETPDSSVGMYFDPRPLQPGERRMLVTYYGLGKISSAASGNQKLGLFGPARVRAGDPFYLTAVIATPTGEETVQIILPEGFQLAEGEPAQKAVGGVGQPYTQVSWMVYACVQKDSADIKVTLGPGAVAEIWTLAVDPVGITRPGGTCP